MTEIKREEVRGEKCRENSEVKATAFACLPLYAPCSLLRALRSMPSSRQRSRRIGYSDRECWHRHESPIRRLMHFASG